MTIEITEAPEALYDPNIPTTELALYGCRIGDSAALIDRSKIDETTNWMDPDPASLWPEAFRESPESFGSMLWSEKRWFFVSSDHDFRSPHPTTYEWLLSDRIDSVLKNGGALHIKGAHSYGVEEGRIDLIRLDLPEPPITFSLSKSNVIKLFGMPDFIREVPHPEDWEMRTTEIGYKRGIWLRYDYWDGQFTDLNIYSETSNWIERMNLEPYVGQDSDLFNEE